MTEIKIRIIKRYANRKLYDTRDSRYVTLDQISEMIRLGEDVKVIDNNNKEDLTSVTLAQIIFEEEKRKKSFLPLAALRKIIQNGGASLQDLVTQISESAERMGRVFRRDEPSNPSDNEAVASEMTNPSEGNEGGLRSEPTKMIREFIDGIQETMDSWQKKLDTSVHGALESISPLSPLQKEIQTLRDRIIELEQKLETLEKGGGGSDPTSIQ